ncbi:TetR/AcrR family transcriptional regulator [Glaciibacter psychrotolerans]|uniref:AcrR family transcriptional regulator n=1 Tax=Glaciibacter psychrotolerans TaxID=670054 RepID=A0A7Z0J5X7_9MICO|nr:TetR/AcrR family transcriptional regulator [Leifsonia psychrotolerans]NYJ19942.1 AcrR family transcriptional regulator [Leifsonia psychrotolerans]
MAETTVSRAHPALHARVRILETADRLFYSEGIHTVGVDRLIAEAQVTKATFYKYYRSKDNLIVAYVTSRDERARALVADIFATYASPAERLKNLGGRIAGLLRESEFYGCAFVNAAAQFPEATHPVRQAVDVHREWYGVTIEDLFRALGHHRPGDAADDFLLARDGAYAGASLGDPVAAQAALRRAVARSIGQAEA